MKSKRKFLLVLGLIAVFLIIGVGAYVAIAGKERQAATTLTDGVATTSAEVTERSIPTPPADLDLPLSSPVIKDAATTKHIGVLLLGYGGPGHQGGFLSDVIMMVDINVTNKKMGIIHIPRDLWVSIPAGSITIPAKINAALAMGTKTNNYPTKDLPKDSVLRGSYLSKQALIAVTGLPIDYVIGVDFSGLARAIDSLGGVTVEVPHTFEDQWYPVKGRELELCGKTPEEVTDLTRRMSGFELEKQFPCRYEQLRFTSGKTTMNGDTALKFVRSRHSATHGGDFARGQRQTALLLGIKDKLFSLNALNSIPKFFTQLSKSIKTDITAEAVTALLPILRDLASYQTVQVGLNTSNVLVNGKSAQGAYILLPKEGNGKWSGVQQYINSQLGK